MEQQADASAAGQQTVGAAFRLLQEGAFDGAEALAARLIYQDTPGAEVHYIRGMALMQLGRAEEAAQCLWQAAELDRDTIEYAYAYGGALLSLQQWETAARLFQAVETRRPGFRDSQFFNGLANLRAGRWPEALRILKSLRVSRPADARIAQAMREAEMARLARPDLAANAKEATERKETAEAIYWLTEALRVMPADGNLLWQLGCAHAELRQMHDAIATYRLLHERCPGHPMTDSAYFNIAWCYSGLLMAEEAAAGYRAYLDRGAADPVSRKNALHEILYYLPQIAGTTPAELRDLAVGFYRSYGAGIAMRTQHANTPDPERRLRIGFVSRLFGRWSYSRQIIPMLRHNDPEAFEITCYHTAKGRIEPIIRAEKASWREVEGKSHDEIAAIIEADGIDILIDCNGASPTCGFEIFCRKPAPVQVGWSNKAMTTGNPAMDYFVADDVMLEGQDDFFTEKLYRMPCYYVPYPILDDAPPVSAPPFFRKGHITFGSLATPSKFGRECWQAWGRVLQAVPDARFLVKNAQAALPAFQSYVRERFGAEGVDPARIDFAPGAPHREFLEAYGEIDLALDTMPVGGGNTIVEALWQGVPTISKYGPFFVSRSSPSIFGRVGLAEFAAPDIDGFVARALHWARRPEELARLRDELRPRLAESTLFDGAHFARCFQAALRFMWREYCGSRREGRPMRSGPLAG